MEFSFGDLKNDDFDDSVITNNQDALKIIRTVAKATVDFLNTYPNRKVFINPVDRKRKTLYNYVFQKNFKDIDAVFNIVGTIEQVSEPYSPSNIYDSFTITLKKN